MKHISASFSYEYEIAALITYILDFTVLGYCITVVYYGNPETAE